MTACAPAKQAEDSGGGRSVQPAQASSIPLVRSSAPGCSWSPPPGAERSSWAEVQPSSANNTRTADRRARKVPSAMEGWSGGENGRLRLRLRGESIPAVGKPSFPNPHVGSVTSAWPLGLTSIDPNSQRKWPPSGACRRANRAGPRSFAGGTLARAARPRQTRGPFT